ncbi:hypothetical protein OS493_018855 [Desmophyllum pertusum]|uniref:Uncharacterized protein n=1 Tax=Desmophyllum pertusum TaxID=174260 RepID=A0A9W9ZF83_9CNID|nr:hypothetical protein OS493_018855 [Desmophyllum pertusum]
MSTSVDISQSPIPQASPCFDIQEFRSRSQASEDSFEDFLPAIDVMSICARLSKQKSAFGSVDNRRRRRANAAKKKRKDELSSGTNAHSQRWGYSSPAFHCRSPPAQLYKYRNSLKLENNSTEHCDVPGMTVQQAILFRRTFSTNNQDNVYESRKHNNTPVWFEAAPQRSLKKHVSMPDLTSMQTCHGGREGKDSGNCGFLHQAWKNVSKRVKCQREVPANLENNTSGAKCSLYLSAESQENKKDIIQAKKIDIKLPCLDTNQDT